MNAAIIAGLIAERTGRVLAPEVIRDLAFAIYSDHGNDSIDGCVTYDLDSVVGGLFQLAAKEWGEV